MVPTTMAALHDGGTWNAPPLRVRIGHALLRTEEPKTAKELALSIHTHQSNVKKEADRTAELGLITASSDLSRAAARPGRPAQIAYLLSSEQRLRAEADLPAKATTRSTATTIRRGQEVVTAAADADHLGDLLHVLAEANVLESATWVAVCGQEMLIAFDEPDPIVPALSLVAVLDAARIPSRHASVSSAGPVAEVIDMARGAAPEMRRARMRRDSRHV
jgi:hypothetical protein